MTALERLIKYSDRYQISIQFWPEQTSVFIMKDHVDLTSFGGGFDETIKAALDYLNRINKVKP